MAVMSSRTLVAFGSFTTILLVAAGAAGAEPATALDASVSATIAVDLDADVGAGSSVRGEVGRRVSSRVLVGGHGELAVTRWEGGDTAVVGGIGPAVRVRLHPGVVLAPSLALAAERRDGDWSPVYASTVAVALGGLRLGVTSRAFFEDARATELHVFVGWTTG
jgi:hypothetical protein